jgi:hypothetical protein
MTGEKRLMRGLEAEGGGLKSILQSIGGDREWGEGYR